MMLGDAEGPVSPLRAILNCWHFKSIYWHFTASRECEQLKSSVSKCHCLNTHDGACNYLQEPQTLTVSESVCLGSFTEL